MTARREIIRNILSSAEKENPQSVENIDYRNITQINIFFGSIQNPHFSDMKNAKQNIGNGQWLCPYEIQRKNAYKICHEIAKKYSMYPQMKRYMKKQWNTKSIYDLCDTALMHLLHFMQDMKSKKIERELKS